MCLWCTCKERDQADSASLRDEYVRHFLQGEFVVGQELEARLSKTLVPKVCFGCDYMHDLSVGVGNSCPHLVRIAFLPRLGPTRQLLLCGLHGSYHRSEPCPGPSGPGSIWRKVVWHLHENQRMFSRASNNMGSCAVNHEQVSRLPYTRVVSKAVVLVGSCGCFAPEPSGDLS